MAIKSLKGSILKTKSGKNKKLKSNKETEIMTKSAKRNTIVSAILAIMLCISLMAGATFALFTSESKVNIAVTSGKVNVVATISDLSLYTPTEISTEEGNTITNDANIATTNADGLSGTFGLGGTATLDGGTLKLDRMAPGDKVTCNIKVTNNSNVAIKYRTVISCEEDDGLFEELTVTIGGTTYSGISKKSNWEGLTAGAEIDPATVPVEIKLPTTADDCQDKSCTVSYKVEAVQGNAAVTDPDPNVIEISNATELNLFRASVNKDNDLYAGKTIKLTASIDLGGAEWTPIMMTGNNGNPVTFDGQGYTISNFKVTAAEGKKYQGLFGTANFSTVQNLYVDNATVKGYGYVAAIVGYGMVTTIEGCKVTNSDITTAVWWDPAVNGYNDGDKAGAVIGWTNEGTCNIINCTVDKCTVTGYRDIAGLVGFYGTTGSVGQVTGNTVTNTRVIQNLTNGYQGTTPDTIHEIVGRWGDGFALDTASNTTSNVTFETIYPVYDVTPATVQDYLDGKYGTLEGATLVLAEGTYDKLELGRATKYAASNTVWYKADYVSTSDDTGYYEKQATPVTDVTQLDVYTKFYVRTMKGITIKAADGATVNVAGLSMTSAYTARGKDYVIEQDESYYYTHLNVDGLSFENLNFTAQCNINSDQAETTITNVTFTGCTFTTNGTASTNGAGLRYYNEQSSTVSNLTVERCKFTNSYQGIFTQNVSGVKVKDSKFNTTGHNAIAIKDSINPFNYGAVEITNNEFNNIGDRIIRFGHLAAGTGITITSNIATESGDGSAEVIKADRYVGDITYNISGNNWGTKNGVNAVIPQDVFEDWV